MKEIELELIPVESNSAGVEITLEPVEIELEPVPVLKSAPPENLWQKTTGYLKDMINPRPAGTMAPAEKELNMTEKPTGITANKRTRYSLFHGTMDTAASIHLGCCAPHVLAHPAAADMRT